MNANLVQAAVALVENQQVLVNLVSRRVRQLTLGHRPMVDSLPSVGHADVALNEIIQGKLTFEFRASANPSNEVEVIEFPGVVAKKASKAA